MKAFKNVEHSKNYGAINYNCVTLKNMAKMFFQRGLINDIARKLSETDCQCGAF